MSSTPDNSTSNIPVVDPGVSGTGDNTLSNPPSDGFLNNPSVPLHFAGWTRIYGPDGRTVIGLMNLATGERRMFSAKVRAAINRAAKSGRKTTRRSGRAKPRNVPGKGVVGRNIHGEPTHIGRPLVKNPSLRPSRIAAKALPAPTHISENGLGMHVSAKTAHRNAAAPMIPISVPREEAANKARIGKAKSAPKTPERRIVARSHHVTPRPYMGRH